MLGIGNTVTDVEKKDFFRAEAKGEGEGEGEGEGGIGTVKQLGQRRDDL